MMFRSFAIFYGLLFLIFGIFGFIPAFVQEGELFGIFKVNVMSNIIHLLTGLAGFGALFTCNYYMRLYFQLVGFIYAILGLFGLIYGESPMMGMIANNGASTWLHIIFAVLALILGFGTKNSLEQK